MTGKILSTYCNCMAGLGEASSHIGAVLFYVEASSRIRDSKTQKIQPLLDSPNSMQGSYICRGCKHRLHISQYIKKKIGQ